MSKKVTNIFLRNGIWQLDYIHPITKKRVRHSAETTIKEKAIELFNREYGAAWDQANLGKSTSMTVRQLIDWCWDIFWRHREGADKHVRYLAVKVFLDKFGEVKATDVTLQMLMDFMWERTRQVKKRTVQLEFTHVSCAYNQAIKNGLLSKNPFKLINQKIWQQGMNGKKGRERIGTPKEIQLMLENSAGMLQKIIEFDLNSGLRKGQIENLKRTDVDLINRKMTVSCGKGGTYRTYEVPIYDRALEILKSLPMDTEYIFTNQLGEKIPEDGVIHAGFPRLMKRCGIQDFHFHDLRHTFATDLYRKTKNLKYVQEVLGHTDSKTTEIYLNLTKEDLAQNNGFRFGEVRHVYDTSQSLLIEIQSKNLDYQP